jgi:hypothetical protein
MDHLGTIFNHLIAGVFNIATRATIAGSVTYEFNLLILIPIESTLAITHRPQALSTCTSTVAIANDNPYIRFFRHVVSPIFRSL